MEHSAAAIVFGVITACFILADGPKFETEENAWAYGLVTLFVITAWLISFFRAL